MTGGRLFGGRVGGVQSPAAPCLAPRTVETGAEEEGRVDERQERTSAAPEGGIDLIGAPVLLIEGSLDAFAGGLDAYFSQIADDDLDGILVGRAGLGRAFNDKADCFAAAVRVDAETVAVLFGVAGVIQQLTGAIGVIIQLGVGLLGIGLGRLFQRAVLTGGV